MRLLQLLLVFSVAITQSFAQKISSLELGKRQSPINIQRSMAKEQVHSLDMHYAKSHEHIEHKEHSVKLVYDPGSFVSFDGRRYEFKQLHYHTPSEHYLDSIQYPVEMHMVHEHQEGERTSYLVIAILYKFGKEDLFLKRFLDEVPKACIDVDIEEKSLNVTEEFTLNDLKNYYHYEGSLTTPPFTETVDWLIVADIHEMSADQIVHLSELEGRNNRELQSARNRLLEHCTGGATASNEN